MGKEIIVVGVTETDKKKFHYCKNLILSGDVDIKKYRCLASIISSGVKSYKCIIGYQDGNYKIKSLSIMPQKTCA